MAISLHLYREAEVDCASFFAKATPDKSPHAFIPTRRNQNHPTHNDNTFVEDRKNIEVL